MNTRPLLIFAAFCLIVFQPACSPPANRTPAIQIPKLFALSFAMETGKEPSFLITEDFDKDGNLDLVVTNSAEHTFSFFKGNADGSFNKPTLYPTGADPICVVGSDFNRDGYMDLAVLNYADQNIHVFMNTRIGGFKNTGKVLKPGKIPINLTSADFNEDGFPDLAVSMRYHKVMLLIGKGDGTFKKPETLPARGQPTGIVVGDYNKDKHIDIAVALAGSGNVGVEIFWGKGEGKFEPSPLFKGGGQPLSIANVDVNRDGYMDLITSSNSLHALTQLINNQDGTFTTLKDFASGEFPKFVAADDFSGDGVPDLVVTNATNDTISISLGRGDGTYTYPPVYHHVDEYPQGIALGDFNKDGQPDIAVSCRDKNIINVFTKKKMGVISPVAMENRALEEGGT